ncbi:uncharacterized protein LOC115329034 [Ixodes scapularis]|uniref:uncharacterized protein LOC115329034 n=1 Tax=Ixodes scapularis TaxID=6945 RepID=UPI001A9EFBC5|nr:uncharacterized protein LOC115329034 [Ixodes scapularis]
MAQWLSTSIVVGRTVGMRLCCGKALRKGYVRLRGKREEWEFGGQGLCVHSGFRTPLYALGTYQRAEKKLTKWIHTCSIESSEISDNAAPVEMRAEATHPRLQIPVLSPQAPSSSCSSDGPSNSAPASKQQSQRVEEPSQIQANDGATYIVHFA